MKFIFIPTVVVLQVKFNILRFGLNMNTAKTELINFSSRLLFYSFQDSCCVRSQNISEDVKNVGPTVNKMEKIMIQDKAVGATKVFNIPRSQLRETCTIFGTIHLIRKF